MYYDLPKYITYITKSVWNRIQNAHIKMYSTYKIQTVAWPDQNLRGGKHGEREPIRATKYAHVTPLLRELRWLRVLERITFRLATLVYGCQHNMAPHYLAIQLHRDSSVAFRQRLRSASTSELIIPRTVHSAIGDRAFRVTAARAWNTLTPSVQSSESLTIFRRRRKTELFSRSFPD